MNFESISIENFGVFENETKFHLAPITILTGKNNSGKSTFIKFIRLLKNSFDDDLFQDLNFSSSGLKIRGFKKAKNRNSKNDKIKFKINNWLFTYIEHPNTSLYATLQELAYLSEDGKELFLFENFLSTSDMLTGLYNLSIFYDNIINNEEFSKQIGLSNEDIIHLKNIFKKHKLSLFLSYNNMLYNGKIKPQGFPGNEIEEAIKRMDPDDEIKNIDWYVKNFEELDSLNKEEQKFLIFNCTRIKKKIYEISFDLLKFSKSFSFETVFLDAFRGDSLHSISAVDPDHPLAKFCRFYLKNYGKSEFSHKDEVNEHITYWTKYFDFGDTLNIDFDYDTFNLILQVIKNKKAETLAEIGFGSSQLIPIILLTSLYKLYKPRVIIEEPESHLHPNLQSKLANLFSEYIKNKGTVVLETHSEYMIRKFQYLVAEGELDSSDIIIYYFNNPSELHQGEKQVREIRIEKNGMLSSGFGKGFFDEADNAALELYRIQKKKTF